MAVTFRKSWKVFPGVRLNVGRKSRSWTIGPRWLKRTFSSTGRRTTSADLPGPFGWRRTSRH
jgi:uncharacterized protein DUF4236